MRVTEWWWCRSKPNRPIMCKKEKNTCDGIHPALNPTGRVQNWGYQWQHTMVTCHSKIYFKNPVSLWYFSTNWNGSTPLHNGNINDALIFTLMQKCKKKKKNFHVNSSHKATWVSTCACVHIYKNGNDTSNIPLVYVSEVVLSVVFSVVSPKLWSKSESLSLRLFL